MKRLPVSCFIIAKNEADRIEYAIHSVQSWVDEVVVVIDCASTDDTLAVARNSGCKVISQPWLGFGGQKRFGEDICRNDWLLNLDADEVVTLALQEEIRRLFEHKAPARRAYSIPIDLVYPGATAPRFWPRDHRYVRLYDRRVVRYRNSPIHDSVLTGDFAVGRLKASIHHHSIRSFAHLATKLDERTWLLVENAKSRTSLSLALRLPVEFQINFLKYYIFRHHFTGGWTGIKYSAIQSWYRLMKVYRLCITPRSRRNPT
ncbi:glycosyltransferase family 2 protein [Hyphomicrobium sp. MC1]|uniref:glycosyltransferase family 2 protein n=1 Tax=Hyphomicrobium sp. (strain MC1) TaxID=717785 RepID=UPI000213D5BA|nr:glycosyltransferase family 2 protein [Hyphomicrobium sp. MC1]CCB65034.1 Glycosyl transferase family 2 [Hyphomicrobium sp. MC1]